MKKTFLSGGCGWFAGLIFLFAPSAEATIHYVAIHSASFSPAALTIEAGDTVEWENMDPFFPHTTTSDLAANNPNYWIGQLVDQGDTFDHTFNDVGTFTYHDGFDPSTGSITVTAPAPAGIVLADPRKVGNQFFFDATGLTVGKTNVVLASTNLTAWTAIKTNVANTAAMTFTNTMTLPRRFFRVVEQP